jgi:hypothetical protein
MSKSLKKIRIRKKRVLHNHKGFNFVNIQKKYVGIEHYTY